MLNFLNYLKRMWRDYLWRYTKRKGVSLFDEHLGYCLFRVKDMRAVRGYVKIQYEIITEDGKILEGKESILSSSLVIMHPSTLRTTLEG